MSVNSPAPFRPLARQIVGQILLFSFILSTAIVGWQIWRSYQEEDQRIATMQSTILHQYAPILAQSVWEVDLPSVQATLKTVSALPGIAYAELLTDTGQRLSSSSQPLTVHPARVLEIPLMLDRVQPVRLGTLRVMVTNSELYARLQTEAVKNSTAHLLEVVLIGFFLWARLNYRYVRPLNRLAEYLRNYQPGAAEHSPLPAMRSERHSHDELDVLIDSFDKLQSSLEKHITEQAKSEVELAEHRDRLAELVAARTAELDHLNRIQQLISELSTRFINVSDESLENLFGQSLEHIGRFLSAQRCYLLILRSEREVEAVHEWDEEGVPAIAAMLEQGGQDISPLLVPMLTHQNVIVLDAETLASHDPFNENAVLTHFGVATMVLVKVRLGKTLFGVFGCDSSTARHWTEQEVGLMRLIGEMLANALTRRQQLLQLKATRQQLEESNAHLQILARRDALTGLANRLHFDEMKRLLLENAQLHGSSFSILVCDIDHFKSYNDHYGHPAGDTCLTRVSGALRTVFQRSGDLIARIGGEEFAVLLPGADAHSALRLAEEMRMAVIQLDIPHEASPVAPYVTISVGAATLDGERHENIGQLVAEADAALYQAKNSGRNQVRLFSPPRPQQVPALGSSAAPSHYTASDTSEGT
jgi:diguanylate cyclase (GGDEF)-like protein